MRAAVERATVNDCVACLAGNKSLKEILELLQNYLSTK